MIEFQENAQTDRRTDGRTDRPYFIGPFQLLLRIKKTKQSKTKQNLRNQKQKLYEKLPSCILISQCEFIFQCTN